MPPATHPLFGTQLRRLRRAADLTQEKLAEQAGYSVAYISMLERGQRLPLPITVHLLADALGLEGSDRESLAAALRGQIEEPGHLPPGNLPRPLVGRAHEMAVLERHLAGAAPRILLLAGEPGIGKSRLLQEAASRGALYGWQVLVGSCTRHGGQHPYAPLINALAGHVQRQPAARLRVVLEGCAWLVRLLPELAETGLAAPPNWTLSPEQERRLVYHAVLRFLARAAAPAGVLLVLDDLQWAGLDALDLLSALLRGAETPLRVVAAYRDTEVPRDAPLAATLADLAQAGLATQLTLAPLGASEAAQLFDHLAEDVQPALRARLLERAGGVPFFLVSCAQALRTGTLVGSGGETVPWNVAQSVRQRITALPESGRDLLDVAAVAGPHASNALLVSVLARPETVIHAALDAAHQARLLEDTEGGYAFTHDVIRDVVEQAMSAERRGTLHRQVAAVLEQRRDRTPAELLAYHYRQGGAPDKAALYLEQAGDRAQGQTAHAAAESYYREAVEVLDGLERTRDALRVREKLGAVLATAARYDAALVILEEAAATYQRDGDVQGLARTVTQIGAVHNGRGTPEEGVRRLQPVVDTLNASGATRELADLYAVLAGLFAKSGRYDEQCAAAERAVDLARRTGDDALLIRAQSRRGAALLVTGHVDAALPLLDEVVRLADAAGDLDVLYSALTNAGTAYMYQGQFERSRTYVERAVVVTERRGDPTRMIRARCNRGELAYYTGDWRRARTEIEAAAELSESIGASAAAPYPLLALGLLALAEGAWDEAGRYLQECIAVAAPSGDLQALRWAHGLLAERDLLAGRPDQARLRLVPLCDYRGHTDLDVTFLLPLLAWVHLELGDTARAARVIAEAITHARDKHDHLSLVDALRVRGMLAIQQRRWTGGARALDEGLALARQMPYPYAEGRLLHTYGLLHTTKGEPRAARERLAAALAIFHRLGARQEIARAEMVRKV